MAADKKARKAQISILCFSTDIWGELPRRREQLMTRLAGREEVKAVLYVELPVKVSDLLKRPWRVFSDAVVRKGWQRAIKGGLRQLNESLYLFTPIYLFPLGRFRPIHRANQWVISRLIQRLIKKLELKNLVLWLYWPYDVYFTGQFGEKLVCYDCFDDLTAFSERPSSFTQKLVEDEKDLLKKADLVFVVSERLLELKKDGRSVHLIPNGVDVELFSQALSASVSLPADVAEIKKPIIGYVGGIWQRRMDYSLLQFLAESRPEWSFVMVGPTVDSVPTSLTDRKNVYFLGAKRQGELPGYLRAFDVCIIPHQINKLTESMDPLKIYEYLAAGKLVVSTGLPRMRDFPDVIKVAETKEDFLLQIEHSLVKESQVLVDRRRKVAAENSWEKRVESILQLVLERIEASNA